MLNFHQLRVFHAIAREGSVSRAARSLRISQPAVSRQLAEFESSLGLRLFDRLPRGVRLTPAGIALRPFAERIFEQEVLAEAELTAQSQLQAERLQVGASTTLAAYLAPGLFGALKRLHPELELRLRIGNTAVIQEAVRSGTVDLGLTEGLPEGEDLSILPFAKDRLVPICASGHPVLQRRPVSWERLLAYPLLMREPGSGTREVVERALEEAAQTYTVGLELGSTEAIKSAVAAHLGIGFVSSLALNLELKSGSLVEVPLAAPPLTRDLHIVLARHREPTPLESEFLALVREPPAPRARIDYAI